MQILDAFFLNLSPNGGILSMNKTVELVNAWADFEKNHPESGVEEFCRHYLTKTREKQNKEKLFAGAPMPPKAHMIMSKLMGRIMRMFEVYANEAIKEIGVKKAEEFFFLNYTYHAKNPKKTEVIYDSVTELTTGLAVLEQLRKAGLITEKADPGDKRSKRVSVTAKGEKVLFACYKQFGKVGEIIFGDMPEEDQRLCIQLLQPIDSKHAAIWQQSKGKDFNETYKSLVKNTDICVKTGDPVSQRKGKK